MEDANLQPHLKCAAQLKYLQEFHLEGLGEKSFSVEGPESIEYTMSLVNCLTIFLNPAKKKGMKQDKLIGEKNIKHKTNKFHSAFGYFSLISVLDILRSF